MLTYSAVLFPTVNICFIYTVCYHYCCTAKNSVASSDGDRFVWSELEMSFGWLRLLWKEALKQGGVSACIGLDWWWTGITCGRCHKPSQTAVTHQSLFSFTDDFPCLSRFPQMRGVLVSRIHSSYFGGHWGAGGKNNCYSIKRSTFTGDKPVMASETNFKAFRPPLWRLFLWYYFYISNKP